MDGCPGATSTPGLAVRTNATIIQVLGRMASVIGWYRASLLIGFLGHD